MPGRPGGGRGASRQTAVAALATALAATCLHAVLSGRHWYLSVVLVVVVVATIGAACRWVRIPAAAAVPAQLAAVLLTCTALYARAHAFGGFVPTPTALGDLGGLLSAGGNDLRTVLFPATATPELAVLGVGAVGIVAVLVDTVAVRLRRPTLAGLPLLLLVAVPAAIRERSVGYLALFAAVLGFLLLLSLDAEERTGRWGRVLPNPGMPMPSATAGTSGPALQIGLSALALAVLVPLAIPGAGSSPFGSGVGPGNGGSHGSAEIVDPLVSVSTQLTMSTHDLLLTVASPVPSYLRLTALEQFGDPGFTLGPISAPESARVSKGLPPDGQGGVLGQPISATITAGPRLVENLLPVPYGTSSVAVAGDWRLSSQTRTIFSSGDTTRGIGWSVRAVLPNPDAATLTAGGSLGVPAAAFPTAVAADLGTPGDLPAVLLETARSWTAGTTTRYAAALAIQRHFTDGAFRYDTTVRFDPGLAAFGRFLAVRRGFCEQYATTMAAMLRTLGIPARVAIGFTGGTRRADGTYAITGGDAHAWPEVWFSTAGWVRFEPTPRADGQTTSPGYTVGVPAPGPGSTTPGSTPAPAPGVPASAPGGTLRSKLDRLPGDGGGSTADPVPARAAGHRGLPVQVLLLTALAVLVVLAALPGLSAALRRRRRLRARGPGSVEGIWAQLLDDATDRGIGTAPGLSPRATAHTLLRAVPRDRVASTAVDVIVTAVERSRYAPDGDGQATEALADQERVLRAALGTDLTPGGRVRATLMPTSGRARIREGLGLMLPWLLGRIDRLVDRIAGRRRAATI